MREDVGVATEARKTEGGTASKILDVAERLVQLRGFNGFSYADVAEELEFLLPSGTVQLLTVDGRPAGIQLPASVELAVSETEPGVRGDTVSNVTKPAKLETGAVIQVPLFVANGDRIKVDPREARYISRA